MEAVVRMTGGLRRRQKTSDGGLEVRTGRNHFDGWSARGLLELASAPTTLVASSVQNRKAVPSKTQNALEGRSGALYDRVREFTFRQSIKVFL